jgi:hypothetical protein
MSIIGLRTVADFTVDGQRPKNWREGILKLYPNGKTPLTALTSLMKSRSVDDPEFNWYEREVTNRRFKLAASITAASTTFTFDSTRDVRELHEGTILQSEQNGEQVRVAQDPSNSTQVIVERGFASTTAAAITYNGLAINPNWMVVGSAFEEGSLPPSGVQLDPTKVYNLTQIFRETLENTRTAQKTRLRTGDLVKQAKADCLELISMDMERAYLFGKRYEGTKNGKPIRTMNGIIPIITAGAPENIITAGATTSLATLEDYIEQAFRYGSSEKVCFCGNQFALAVQRIIRKNTSFQIMSGIKEFGMNVMRITTPFGDLVLKTHPMFNMMSNGYNSSGGACTATTKYYGMASWGLILDMKELQYVYLKESDLQYQAKLEANGLDGDKSGYLAECSLELHFPKAHMLIKSLKAAAVDS